MNKTPAEIFDDWVTRCILTNPGIPPTPEMIALLKIAFISGLIGGATNSPDDVGGKILWCANATALLATLTPQTTAEKKRVFQMPPPSVNN